MTRSLFTLSDIARTGAERFCNETALEDARGTHRLTYGELWARVQTSAGVLRALGLAPRDRVLLYMDGSPDWIAAFLSIVHADLVAVPIPGQTPPELARAAAWYAEVKACVCGNSTRDGASRIPAVCHLTPADLAVSHASPLPVTTATPDATAVLLFTSGSTSNPRAVALGHDNLLANLRSLVEIRRAREGEALLSILPPSHAFELVAGQLAPLAAGARIVYAGTLLPNRLVELMRERAITRMLSVPSLVDVLAREILGILAAGGTIESTCRDLTIEDLASAFRRMAPPEQGRIRRAVRNCVGPSFRNLVVGGAALAPVWADLLPGIGIELEVGYGLTEAGPIVAVGFEAECPSGSVGRPLPAISVHVDVHGEILVRSEGVMQGYFKDAAGSAAALQDGWLRTGDCGRLDDEGFLFVTGRLKDAIVTASGESIYPDEIEPFYNSPLFAGHCVVPVRGRDGNDVPTLVVEPASTGTSDAELQQAFLALRAAAPPRLRAASMVRYAGRLPRTALGKIKRRALADSLAGEGVPA